MMNETFGGLGQEDPPETDDPLRREWIRFCRTETANTNSRHTSRFPRVYKIVDNLSFALVVERS